MAMPCTSSWMAQRTISATERLCPRWITSAPADCMSRRMTLMAASWPSKRDAALTMRTWWRGLYGAAVGGGSTGADLQLSLQRGCARGWQDGLHRDFPAADPLAER